MRFSVKIGEKDIDFSLGLSFLGEFIDIADASIDEIGVNLQKNPFKWIPLLMYHSANHVAKIGNKELDFTLFELTDLIENNGGIASAPVTLFMKKFIESLTKDVPKEEVQSGEIAKKK